MKIEGLKTKRMIEGPCKRACAKNSNLCKICLGREEKYMLGINTTKWHGRIGGPIAPESHIIGSEWNKADREREARKAAKGGKRKTVRKKRNSRRNTVTGPIIYKPVTHYNEQWF